jgi:enamine deaminase RidA (YjgF/YER057c/UK114 family)
MSREFIDRKTQVRVSASRDWAILHTTISAARRLNALDLQRRSCNAFADLSRTLQNIAPVSHPVRFWNFIPGIGDAMGDGLDRYMVFNAGRFAAFHGWCPAAAGSPWTATASAVGHDGDDLYLWCLASCRPGESVENPRQKPVRQYSDRYGPMPPSFARATIVSTHPSDHEPLLLVGGTASICGEQSRHEGDLTAQVEETLANLEALTGAAMMTRDSFADERSRQGQSLEQFTHVRVYWVKPSDRQWIERLLYERLPKTCVVEWVKAALCRPELLVEIEGVANLRVGARRHHLALVSEHA